MTDDVDAKPSPESESAYTDTSTMNAETTAGEVKKRHNHLYIIGKFRKG
jgi:hypothetical protein